jgi:hypothetical protein
MPLSVAKGFYRLSAGSHQRALSGATVARAQLTPLRLRKLRRFHIGRGRCVGTEILKPLPHSGSNPIVGPREPSRLWRIQRGGIQSRIPRTPARQQFEILRKGDQRKSVRSSIADIFNGSNGWQVGAQTFADGHCSETQRIHRVAATRNFKGLVLRPVRGT